MLRHNCFNIVSYSTAWYVGGVGGKGQGQCRQLPNLISPCAVAQGDVKLGCICSCFVHGRQGMRMICTCTHTSKR
jgi:hypothetical protein